MLSGIGIVPAASQIQFCLELKQANEHDCFVGGIDAAPNCALKVIVVIVATASDK